MDFMQLRETKVVLQRESSPENQIPIYSYSSTGHGLPNALPVFCFFLNALCESPIHKHLFLTLIEHEKAEEIVYF